MSVKKNVLEVDDRKEQGRSVRRLSNGRIPAIVYGQKEAAEMLWVDATVFQRVFAQAGESQIIELMKGKKEPVSVIVRDVQRDPLTYRVRHIDFYRLAMKEEIEADIPVSFIGESSAVKEYSGMLMHNIDAITVRCLPSDLPESIEVDLSVLKELNDRVVIGDLSAPQGVVFVIEDDVSVVSVAPPRVEEVMEEVKDETSDAATDGDADDKKDGEDSKKEDSK